MMEDQLLEYSICVIAVGKQLAEMPGPNCCHHGGQPGLEGGATACGLRAHLLHTTTGMQSRAPSAKAGTCPP